MKAKRSPLMNSSGMSCAVVLGQRRLRIEEIDLRRRAGHEEIDDALGLGREMQAAARRSATRWRLRLREHDVVHQRGQREAADAEGGLLEEVAARHRAQAESAIGRRFVVVSPASSLLRDRSRRDSAARSATHRPCGQSPLSSLRHRLVQIQQHVRDHRPCRSVGDRRRASDSARAPARTARPGDRARRAWRRARGPA